MKALGGRGIFAPLDAIEDFSFVSIEALVGPFFGVFDIKSWDATETVEPENAGVRIRRKASTDSSTKPTTGAPRRALLKPVS